MIQDDIGAALRAADVQAFRQFAPQAAVPPYTVWRQVDATPLVLLDGEYAQTNSVFVFWNVGATEEAALTQRDAVRAAIRASSELAAQAAVEVSSGEAEYEPATNEPTEPCAFSFWHGGDTDTSGN